MRAAIEAKATARVNADHLKGMRALVQDQPRVRERIVVCLETRARRTDDGILILPASEFPARLRSGKIFGTRRR